jgi:hypothetical protein
MSSKGWVYGGFENFQPLHVVKEVGDFIMPMLMFTLAPVSKPVSTRVSSHRLSVSRVCSIQIKPAKRFKPLNQRSDLNRSSNVLI